MITVADLAQYTFKHIKNIQIRYNDVDINGHVNNAVYHDYFNVGRTTYFDDVLWCKYQKKPDNLSLMKNLIIAQSNTTYVRPVFMHDTICIKTKIIRMGTASIEMLQVVMRGDEVVTINDTTFVCIDQNGKSTPTPEEWKQIIREFENMA